MGRYLTCAEILWSTTKGTVEVLGTQPDTLSMRNLRVAD